jgi:predicted MFS family arabinose efflux permease
MLVGRLFDRYGIVVMPIGIFVAMLATPLAFLGGQTAVVVAVCCWAIGLGVQDASLRAGIAQVVSMNKRGSAFGAFNAVWGVAWFAGSATMGLLYDRSIASLVVFSVVVQLIAAGMFLWVRRPLEAEIAA